MTNSEKPLLTSNSLVDRFDRGCDSRPLLEEADREIERLRAHRNVCVQYLRLGAEQIRSADQRLSPYFMDQAKLLRIAVILDSAAKNAMADEPPAHETLPPRITVMDDGRAMGGSDVCHTCAAHCTVINDLETALRGLYWDNVDYLTLNKLGGMQNHWMRAARMALGMDVDDVRPTQKASEGQS